MTKDQLRAAVGGRAENLDLLQQSTGVKSPDPAAEAGLELGPHHRQRSGGLRLEHTVHLRTERLCYDVRIRCLPHASFPAFLMRRGCFLLLLFTVLHVPQLENPPQSLSSPTVNASGSTALTWPGRDPDLTISCSFREDQTEGSRTTR